MALHPKNEFAKLCGLEPKQLYVYIGRKKVNVVNGTVDDSDQLNKLFMETQRSKRGIAAGAVKDTPVDKKSSKKEKPEPTDAEVETKNTLTGLLKEKNSLELLQRQNIIEIQRIDIQKKRGELIPTSSVKTLITLHSENIKTSYVEASDNLIVILAQRNGMSSVQLADIRKQFLIIINRAIDNAVDSSKRMLGSVVEEFSTKRGVGQHD